MDPNCIGSCTMLDTVASGRLDCAEWLYETFAGESGVDLFKSVPVQEWEEKRVQVHAIDTAAMHGHIDVVKYLHHLAVLFQQNDEKKMKRGETLCGTGPTCSSAAIDLAAANNHRQVVEWLYENREEGFTERTVHLAAINGHVDMVQWLHKHQAHEITSITSDTMDLAAENGHLEVVKWLHELNVSRTTHAMDKAAGHGHLDVVIWLHEHRTEGRTTEAMNAAARCDHLDVVKWLHKYRSEGCTTAAMDIAVDKSCAEVVQCLHFYRKEGCTTAAMDGAAADGCFGLVVFLYCYRREGPTAKAFTNTDDELTQNIYEWLAENYPSLKTLRT